MKKIIMLVAAAILAAAIIGTGAFLLIRGSGGGTEADGFQRIEVTLKNGKPQKALEYTFGTGAQLEFRINSDKDGKLVIASESPQTLFFTENPLTFKITFTKNGTYPITFLKDGSNESEATTITTIHIK